MMASTIVNGILLATCAMIRFPTFSAFSFLSSTRYRPATNKLVVFSTSSSTSSSISSSDDKNYVKYPSIHNKNLVSINDCFDALERNKDGKNEVKNDIKFIDVTWFHKGERIGVQEYEQGPRIKNSIYFDISDISTSYDIYPTLNPNNIFAMLPRGDLLEAYCNYYKISNDDHIIIYGRNGTLFTPRIWFTFKALGHDSTKIHLLQDTLEEWVDSDGPVDYDPVKVMKASDLLLLKEYVDYGNNDYKAKYDTATNVIEKKEMIKIVEKKVKQSEGKKTASGSGTDDDFDDDNVVLIDTRGSSFARKGHMPGAIHIPYSSLVVDNEEEGTGRPDGNRIKLKSKDDLMDIFQQKYGIDPLDTTKQIVVTCGSGVSVNHVVLALEECGRKLDPISRNTVIYDGSWNEWSKDPNTPKSFSTPGT